MNFRSEDQRSGCCVEYYQTWYLSKKNLNNIKLEDFLHKNSEQDLINLLKMFGVDLQVVDSLLVKFPTTTRLSKEKKENKNKIFSNENLDILISDSSQAPNHLVLSLKSKNSTISEISSSEALKIHSKIKQISSIMKEKIGHSHFVVAKGSSRGVAAEIIPVQNHSIDVLNAEDKTNSNHYLLYPNIPSLRGLYRPTEWEITSSVKMWRKSLEKANKCENKKSINNSETTSLIGQWIQIVTDLDLATEQVLHLLSSAFRNVGFLLFTEFHSKRPKRRFMHVNRMLGCPFCSEKIRERQLVYEENDICVLYNHISPIEAGHFLVIPKRHIHQLELLTDDEVVTMHSIEQSLVEVLSNRFGHNKVHIYTQNSPAAGQTVLHTHDKVQVDEPIPHLIHSLKHIAGQCDLVSDEEMARVTQEVGESIRKLRHSKNIEAA